MSEQATLQFPPRATGIIDRPIHSDDPPSSVEAYKSIKPHVGKQEQIILGAMRRYPGLTAKRLAVELNIWNWPNKWDYVKILRRTAAMQRKQLIRRQNVKGGECVWYAIGETR